MVVVSNNITNHNGNIKNKPDDKSRKPLKEKKSIGSLQDKLIKDKKKVKRIKAL